MTVSKNISSEQSKRTRQWCRHPRPADAAEAQFPAHILRAILKKKLRTVLKNGMIRKFGSLSQRGSQTKKLSTFLTNVPGDVVPMIVCLCKGISDRIIKELAQSGHSLREIVKTCQASTCCGACAKELRNIVDKESSQPNSVTYPHANARWP